eukprot:scaffold354_cov116-Isochrysis_galbana.AAC.7
MHPSRPPPDHDFGVSVICTWCTCAAWSSRTTTMSIGLPTLALTMGTMDSETPLYAPCISWPTATTESPLRSPAAAAGDPG